MRTTNEQVAEMGALEALVVDNPDLERLEGLLGQKWNSIYSRAFLTSKDYEDATDEQLAEEINKHWNRFVDHDLPAISDVLRQEQWLWHHGEDSQV